MPTATVCAGLEKVRHALFTSPGVSGTAPDTLLHCLTKTVIQMIRNQLIDRPFGWMCVPLCGFCGCDNRKDAEAEEGGIGETVAGVCSVMVTFVQLIKSVDAEAECDDAFSEVEECSGGAERDGGERGGKGDGGNQDEEGCDGADKDLHNFH